MTKYAGGDYLDARSIRKSAKKLTQKYGLRLPDRPETPEGALLNPEVPFGDPTRLSDREVSMFNWQFTELANYTEARLAVLDSSNEAAKINENMQRVFAAVTGSAKTIKAREAEAAMDDDTRDQVLRHHKRRAELKLMKALHEGYIRKAKVMSREQSRREKSAEGQKV